MVIYVYTSTGVALGWGACAFNFFKLDRSPGHKKCHCQVHFSAEAFTVAFGTDSYRDE